jgi:RNase P subunit RPR2
MSEHHTHLLICTTCYAERVPPARARLQAREKRRPTCMSCGEKAASKVRHTVVNLNKSNYMLFTDPEMLKQTNPKRTT